MQPTNELTQLERRHARSGGWYPRLPLSLLAVCCLVIMAGLSADEFTVAHAMFAPSATPPTTTRGPRVDLSVVDMFVFPPNPAPGELVTLTFQIKNNSLVDSGKFQWSWYADDPGNTPTLEGSVANLKAGDTIVIKREFPFGGWGNFTTFVFVNDQRLVDDTNTTNDVKTRLVTTDAKKPFVIDFRYLANGQQIIETADLTGTEFEMWNMRFAPVVEDGDTKCKDAVAKISVDDVEEIRRLITGLPGQIDKCKSLPIRVTLGKPLGALEANGVEIEFIPTAVGIFSLAVTNADGTSIIASSDMTVSQADVNAHKPQHISVTLKEGTLTDTMLTFTPPIEAITMITQITLIPTATP